MGQKFWYGQGEEARADDLRQSLARFRIADAHCHIYPNKIAAKATAAVSDFYSLEMHGGIGNSETLLANGAVIGCSRYVVCSVATSLAQVESIDRFIAGECTAHPEFVGLGAWHRDVRDIDALLDLTQELGLAGIKVHPDFQKVDIDDPCLMPLYAGLEQRGMPLLLHMGDYRYEFSRPSKLARVLERYPGLKVDAAHFGGWQAWEEAFACLRGSQALFDTSSSFAFMERDFALRLVEGYGVEHLMFGVDFPMWTHQAELACIMSLGLSDHELQALLYGNCARLYGFA